MERWPVPSVELNTAMVAKILYRAAERVELGWAQYPHGYLAGPRRIVGHREQAACLVEHVTRAAREVLGLSGFVPVDVLWAIQRPLHELIRMEIGYGLTDWNDAPGRTPEEVSALCVAGAELVEART